MINGLIGKKLGMSQLFAKDGTLTPVTVIQAGPCPVVQVKTPETDGYEAVQIGFDELTRKKIARPVKSRFAKLNIPPQRVLREFAPVEVGKLPQVGDVIDVKMFQKVALVKVTGKSKGKGFQGTMKRHGFGGGPRSHGSGFHRAPGAIGCRTAPGEVDKGKKMAGRMGNDRVTVRNLAVAQIDADRNLIYVRGAVPGPINGYVTVSVI